MRVSKSRNVCGYVKAVQRASKLQDRFKAAEERFREQTAKLRRDLDLATRDAHERYTRLTGGQIAEVRRILAGGTVRVTAPTPVHYPGAKVAIPAAAEAAS